MKGSTSHRKVLQSVTGVVQTITPDVAQTMLNENRGNRPLSDSWIYDLATRMERGEWEMNGESIIFDNTGSLRDGQHRLSAVVLSGMTVEMMVVRNVEPTAFSTMGFARKRSVSDVLALDGHAGGKSFASFLNVVYLWLSGDKVAQHNN